MTTTEIDSTFDFDAMRRGFIRPREYGDTLRFLQVKDGKLLLNGDDRYGYPLGQMPVGVDLMAWLVRTVSGACCEMHWPDGETFTPLPNIDPISVENVRRCLSELGDLHNLPWEGKVSRPKETPAPKPALKARVTSPEQSNRNYHRSLSSKRKRRLSNSEAMYRTMKRDPMPWIRTWMIADFLDFTYDGHRYIQSKALAKKNIFTLRRMKLVETAYRTVGFAGYRLVNAGYGAAQYPPGGFIRPPVSPGHCRNIAYLLTQIPFDDPAIHDLRLAFTVPAGHLFLSQSHAVHPQNKSIKLPVIELDGVRVQVTVHHNDKVEVIVACSEHPFSITTEGLSRLVEVLTTVQMTIIHAINQPGVIVPRFHFWTVTMWHWGRDGLLEWAGEAITATLQEVDKLLRFYIKQRANGRLYPRIEEQGLPSQDMWTAIRMRLSEVPNPPKFNQPPVEDLR